MDSIQTDVESRFHTDHLGRQVELRSDDPDWGKFKDIFPISVTVHPSLVTEESEVFDWCKENFGPEFFVFLDPSNEKVSDYYEHKEARWDCYDETYWFLDENDALIFRIAWAGEKNI